MEFGLVAWAACATQPGRHPHSSSMSLAECRRLPHRPHNHAGQLTTSEPWRTEQRSTPPSLPLLYSVAHLPHAQ
jgi:hypothetical protein